MGISLEYSVNRMVNIMLFICLDMQLLIQPNATIFSIAILWCWTIFQGTVWLQNYFMRYVMSLGFHASVYRLTLNMLLFGIVHLLVYLLATLAYSISYPMGFWIFYLVETLVLFFLLALLDYVKHTPESWSGSGSKLQTWKSPKFSWENGGAWPKNPWGVHMAVCQNLVPLVNIKIAGKWMFIPLKMVLIGIDPYPYLCQVSGGSSPMELSKMELRPSGERWAREMSNSMGKS